MESWGNLLLMVALISGLLSFTGVAGGSSRIAEIMFFTFMILLLISGIAALLRDRPPV